MSSDFNGLLRLLPVRGNFQMFSLRRVEMELRVIRQPPELAAAIKANNGNATDEACAGGGKMQPPPQKKKKQRDNKEKQGGIRDSC